MWIKPISDWANYAVVLDKSTSESAVQFRIQRNNNLNQLQFFDGTSVVAGGKVITDTWNHVVITINSGTGKLYMNGVEVASGPIKNTLNNYNTTTYIGRYGGGAYYKGDIEEVAVWNRALDAAAVKELFNKGAAKIRVNYRGCNNAACAANTSASQWSAWTNMSLPTNNQINLDALDGNQYMQYSLYTSPYIFPDNNYFSNARAIVNDVNITYSN
jgi:hypothetical protein